MTTPSNPMPAALCFSTPHTSSGEKSPTTPPSPPQRAAEEGGGTRDCFRSPLPLSHPLPPSKAASSTILAERFKTQMCRNYERKGACPYENKCMFAHGDHDMRTPEMNVRDGLFTEESIEAFRRAQRLLKKRVRQLATKAARGEDEADVKATEEQPDERIPHTKQSDAPPNQCGVAISVLTVASSCVGTNNSPSLLSSSASSVGAAGDDTTDGADSTRLTMAAASPAIDNHPMMVNGAAPHHNDCCDSKQQQQRPSLQPDAAADAGEQELTSNRAKKRARQLAAAMAKMAAAQQKAEQKLNVKPQRAQHLHTAGEERELMRPVEAIINEANSCVGGKNNDAATDSRPNDRHSGQSTAPQASDDSDGDEESPMKTNDDAAAIAKKKRKRRRGRPATAAEAVSGEHNRSNPSATHCPPNASASASASTTPSVMRHNPYGSAMAMLKNSASRDSLFRLDTEDGGRLAATPTKVPPPPPFFPPSSYNQARPANHGGPPPYHLRHPTALAAPSGRRIDADFKALWL